MDIAGIIIAIFILGFVLSLTKASKGIKMMGLPKWAKGLKSSDRWLVGSRELFAKERWVKWLLLALLKIALILISVCFALFQVAINAAKSLLPKALKV